MSLSPGRAESIVTGRRLRWDAEGCERNPAMQAERNLVTIYADGACRPNPGKGGYGIIMVENGVKREIAGGFKNTTNNRMELLAIIESLKAVQGEARDVAIFSDSRYVVDSYSSGRAREWEKQDWMRTRKDATRNPDLWAQLLRLCERHKVEMRWVEGHAGHPENERCDELAAAARLRDDLPGDAGYLKPFNPPTMKQVMLNLFQ